MKRHPASLKCLLIIAVTLSMLTSTTVVETVTADMITTFSDGNTEYTLTKEDGSVAATAYMVQMFVHAGSGETCLTPPELLERCRGRWREGGA